MKNINPFKICVNKNMKNWFVDGCGVGSDGYPLVLIFFSFQSKLIKQYLD